ncbi:MAG: hypothetical protein FWC32_09595 [Firmicutes bacterium]|nr:hypothetical protein [Bacillota bacterium]
MSADHGETIMQKPIGEYAKFLKSLLPANIPENYVLKPLFEKIASQENICKGVAAFRDFLYVFYDCLITGGDLYAKPRKIKNLTDYPFLHFINHLLIDFGYYGKLSESGESLIIAEIPSFAASKPKIPVSKQMECLRLLALCGFTFGGIKLEAKTFDMPEKFMEISYPGNPVLLAGLRALAVADIELRTRRYNNDDNLLRCDYRLLKVEDTDLLDILVDYLQPLPAELQKFAIELHRRYIDMGMTCVLIIDDQYHFAYACVKNRKRALSPRDMYQQRVWELAISMKYGYCLAVRAKKTEKYADVIEKFPPYLREKITQGYGCDRKLRNEPCQGGCQGIRIPLDNSILEIKQDIVTWLDNEL